MISVEESKALVSAKQIETYKSHLKIVERAFPKHANPKEYNDNEETDLLQDTVGCIIIDSFGQIATGVSSGGISLKRSGRVGEAALPGSGIWLVEKDNLKIACSISGTGEQIMKTQLATILCNHLIDSNDIASSFKNLMADKFLNSPLLKKEQYKNSGVLLVKKIDNNIEIWWSHTTPSFCIAFAGENSKVCFKLSRKRNDQYICLSGASINKNL